MFQRKCTWTKIYLNSFTAKPSMYLGSASSLSICKWKWANRVLLDSGLLIFFIILKVDVKIALWMNFQFPTILPIVPLWCLTLVLFFKEVNDSFPTRSVKVLFNFLNLSESGLFNSSWKVSFTNVTVCRSDMTTWGTARIFGLLELNSIIS